MARYVGDAVSYRDADRMGIAQSCVLAFGLADGDDSDQRSRARARRSLPHADELLRKPKERWNGRQPFASSAEL